MNSGAGISQQFSNPMMLFLKENCRPLTALSSPSKAFERIMHDQSSPYSKRFLSPLYAYLEKDIVPNMPY